MDSLLLGSGNSQQLNEGVSEMESIFKFTCVICGSPFTPSTITNNSKICKTCLQRATTIGLSILSGAAFVSIPDGWKHTGIYLTNKEINELSSNIDKIEKETAKEDGAIKRLMQDVLVQTILKDISKRRGLEITEDYSLALEKITTEIIMIKKEKEDETGK